MRVVNSKNSKYIIECTDRRYRIGNIHGKIPKNSDCIISGWHIKDGKIIKKGKIILVPGNGHFHIINNIIEFGNNLRRMDIDVSHNVIISGNVWKKPNDFSEVIFINCKGQYTVIGNRQLLSAKF